MSDQSVFEAGIVNAAADPGFRRKLEERGVQNLTRCMQCMKCGVGCPIAFAMDYNPTQIIRMAIIGLKEEVLTSHTIWLCSACETCTTRCPMEIDVAGVMDAIKEIAVEEGYESPEPHTKAFHDVFMGVVRARGRLNEPMLFGHYKLRTKTFFEDLDIGKEIMLKGKIKYSGKVKGNNEVRKIIDRLKPKK
ncbi:MAG: 4Fe-4S dicluster domain-containing protein [bacterium]